MIFGITAVLALAFIVWGFVGTESFGNVASGALGWVITNTGWLFVILASFFVVFVLWLAASKYGQIPLGHDGEKPEFRTSSWIAMMFSAGMGIGLMFFGTAEPLSFFVAPPPDSLNDPETAAAAKEALATTMFHWTLHPWAIYATVGVAIAYSTFRKGRSQLMSSVFAPLFGKHVNGPIGKLINILAIFATLFGSAASLGIGATQISAGLQFNGWIDKPGVIVLVVIITVLTICFILSAVSGIEKGIQMLSNINMVLAGVLALFVFLVGPTLFILNLLPEMLGGYLQYLPTMVGRSEAAGGNEMQVWLSSWTIFYWAWWVSWTPFVGMFIARISRGRTIRQFVTGVLLVPSIVSIIWFAIFGGAGIDAQRKFKDLTAMVDGEVTVNTNSALFQMLDHLPIASVTAVLVMVLVAIFFVSGADAASIVMGTLTEYGTDEPRRGTVIFWGAATGAVAAVMLVAGAAMTGEADKALTGLQNITIVASLPFVVVMGLMAVSLVKDLSSDPLIRRNTLGRRLVRQAVVEGVSTYNSADLRLPVENSDDDPDNDSDPESNGSTPPRRAGLGARVGRDPALTTPLTYGPLDQVEGPVRVPAGAR